MTLWIQFYYVFLIKVLLPTDVDECALQTHMCSHKCINVKGSYRCDCYKGYVLDKNGRTCNGMPKSIIIIFMLYHVIIKSTI